MARLLAGLLGAVLAALGVLALALFFSGRDKAPVAVTGAGTPGAAAARTEPPTRGRHATRPVPGDGRPLTRDELLSALALGNVVILYPGRPRTPPPAALRRVQAEVAGGASTHALTSAGQAVLLSPWRRREVVAAAWGRLLRARSVQDASIARFADFWLGTTPASG